MAEVAKREDDTSALWMGWIGIIAGAISFFTLPVLLGAVAIILGIITAFSKAKALGWWSIVIGVAGKLYIGLSQAPYSNYPIMYLSTFIIEKRAPISALFFFYNWFYVVTNNGVISHTLR